MARNVAVIVAEILTILALTVACIFSFGGMKPGGELDTRYLALIDTSNITSTVSQVTYHGLPDSHDFSKHKDVFAIYLYAYCSGTLDDKDTKDDGKRYKINFCSKPGSELFDQYRLWKVWGVDLATPRNAKNEVDKSIGVAAIKTMPRVILVGFNIAILSLGLTILAGLSSYFYKHWSPIIAAVFSTISSISMLTVSSLCQSLYPTLIHRTNDHPISFGSSNGTLTSRYSSRQLSIFWLVSCLSTLASICLILGALRGRHSARNPKQGPRLSGEDKTGGLGGLVHRTTDRFIGTIDVSCTYQKLGGGGRDALVRDISMEGESRKNISETELIERNENGRDDGTRGSLVHGPYLGLRDGDSRYEPIRHH